MPSSPSADSDQDINYSTRNNINISNLKHTSNTFNNSLHGRGAYSIALDTENYSNNNIIIKHITNILSTILSKHHTAITTMCITNSSSLLISYEHIKDHGLEEILINNSYQFFTLFNNVLIKYVSKLYPNYNLIHKYLYIKIESNNIININNLSNSLYNKYIQIKGIVTHRSIILKCIKELIYECIKCNYITNYINIEDFYLYTVNNFNLNNYNKKCLECQSNSLFINKNKCKYVNIQKITLQGISYNKIYKSVNCVLFGDLIDTIKCGMEVSVSGIYRIIPINNNISNNRNSAGFKELLIVNHIDNNVNINNALGINNIKELALKVNLKEILINSVAPHIYGMDNVKKGILCCLFGGVSKTGEQGTSMDSLIETETKSLHRTRGDINLLIIGDPGTAKSQLLRTIPNIIPKCILTSGLGASSVGLTATVKLNNDNEWVLEGGALVLSDGGVCCIDEFDKMNHNDRVSIHECMEQQTISVSKAGISTSLNARCSVIAVGNPKFGVYNSRIGFKANINIEETLVSRFDLVMIVKDEVSTERDLIMSNFILKSHSGFTESDFIENNNFVDRLLFNTGKLSVDKTDGMNTTTQPSSLSSADSKRNAVTATDDNSTVGFSSINRIDSSAGSLAVDNKVSTDIADTSLLSSYIAHARTLSPQLHTTGIKRITSAYLDLRSLSTQYTTSQIITVRSIESIIRIAESFARMRLSTYVNNTDINQAISLVIESFIATQADKHKPLLYNKLFKYIINDDTNNLNTNSYNSRNILFIINDMFSEVLNMNNNINNTVVIKISDVIKRLILKGITTNLENITNIIKNEGYLVGEKFISFNY
ncbi:DNA replication licensing factor MCM2 [Cucumispora dikerogammari]|nr:DNA replication licensing factor MCM2 [Cucumispora dikerogammari]